MNKKILLILAALLLMPGITNAETYPNLDIPNEIRTRDNNGTSAVGFNIPNYVTDSTSWWYNYYQFTTYNYQDNGIFINYKLNQSLTKDTRYVIEIFLNGWVGMKPGSFKQGIAAVNGIGSDPYNYQSKINLKSYSCTDTSTVISTQSDSILTICTVDFIFEGYSTPPNYISFSVNSKVKGNQNFQFLGYKINNIGTDYTKNLDDIKSDIDKVANDIKNIQNSVESSKQEIIDNQNKNNQEQIDNANKNHQDIMNSDTSGANSTANGFFNNFENNDHGLSGIVTAPLRLIQALTSRTLYQIPITMLDKTVYLPPLEVWLDSLDTNTKYALKTFRVTYNIIVGGLVSYGAVKGIFKKVEELKNPDDSRVEVMDL